MSWRRRYRGSFWISIKGRRFILTMWNHLRLWRSKRVWRYQSTRLIYLILKWKKQRSHPQSRTYQSIRSGLTKRWDLVELSAISLAVKLHWLVIIISMILLSLWVSLLKSFLLPLHSSLNNVDHIFLINMILNFWRDSLTLKCSHQQIWVVYLLNAWHINHSRIYWNLSLNQVLIDIRLNPCPMRLAMTLIWQELYLLC